MARARLLRWADAAVAWLGLFLVVLVDGRTTLGRALLLAAGAVALLAVLPPLRVRWRKTCLKTSGKNFSGRIVMLLYRPARRAGVRSSSSSKVFGQSFFSSPSK